MKTVNYLTRRSMLVRSSLAVFGGALFARAGWLEATDLPLIRRMTLFHPGLPKELEGLVIAQISDVHAGLFMPTDRLNRVHQIVTEAQPDLVVFTGDQLDRRTVDADIFVQGFAGIDAPLGVFGILGNHDHVAGSELAVTALSAAGITPLVNQTALVKRDGRSLLIAGVDDCEIDAGQRANFGILQNQTADFRLLLCHQPSGWRRARNAGAEITLAGHTHGGQIAIPTQAVNVARLSTPYVAGAYLKPNHTLYVSRGVGVGAVPLRVGSPPEIDVLVLARGPLACFELEAGKSKIAL